MVWPGASYWWLIGASLIIGVGTGIFSVVFSYILQMESPDGKVGQMSGMYNSLNGIILLVAPITGGFLVQLFGVFTIFQVIGMITALIGLFGIVMQNVLWGRRDTEKSSNEERDIV